MKATRENKQHTKGENKKKDQKRLMRKKSCSVAATLELLWIAVILRASPWRLVLAVD
jgi:hypothetical protein